MAYKLAVIGLGKIAQDQHLPCIAKNAEFELAAAVSSRGAHGDTPTFKTHEELFASGIKLDAVAICTPPSVRFDIARQAIDAGLHVLLEKPTTPTVGESIALQAHAAAAKKILFATWHSQFNAGVDQAKALLKGKTIAKMHVEWKEDVRRWHPDQEWIWQPGGFGVFDPGINALSIVTKILPMPIFVAESVLSVPANRATPIAVSLKFRPFDGGTAALTAEFDWRQTGEQSWNISITTSDGMQLLLKKGGTRLEVNGKLVVEEPSEEYEAIYAHFATLLKSQTTDMDIAPLQLISDGFMLGRQVAVEAFI